MSTVHAHRQASVEEIAAEMDRRGVVIEKLEAERNLFKGKYRALLKLISKTRDKLVHVTDHIEDEGDRRYFGSTNDADALRDLYDEMMRWVWDAVDEHNRMKSDPYADIRQQRARAETAEAALAAKDAEIEAAHAETNRLLGLIEEAQRCLEGEPEYHDQGMGCGLEDRGITDRYDAMHHGWEQAMERVYGENIAWAKDVLTSALSKQEGTDG